MAKNVCDAGGRRPAATDLGNGLTDLPKNRRPPAKRASGDETPVTVV